MNTGQSSDEKHPAEPVVCARCGTSIDPDDSYLVRSDDGDGQAAICRTEHIVAWVMRGAGWQSDTPWEAGNATGAVTLVRRRAGEEIVEQFESPEGLRAWASAGGHWAK